MSKVKTKITTTEETLPVDEIENDETVKEVKANKFFNFFKNEENFTIHLYHTPKNGRGKQELIDKYENELPDMLEIRKTWGGGKFQLFAHDFNNKMIDSCTINVAELPEGVKNNSDSNPPQKSREDVINEIIQMKALFSGDDNSSAMMIKIMEIQSQSQQQMSLMIATMSEKSMQQQIESERRFSQMIEKMGSKNSVSEMVEIVSVIDSIRGEGGGSSLLDKVVSNPVVQNIAAGLLAPPAGSPSPPYQPISTTEKPAKKLSEYFPVEFINSLTIDKQQKAIEVIMEKAGKTEDEAKIIVDQLMREKDLK